ncbi:hypothetical protein SLEP1_g21565 [Rubroshorea leprosula]|uniref:Uncharacterized protein n=1 Tax=Rubroshorea leprosula TaxID=152421 RepID=A0AAV5JFM4_9ROSI|nr:hypothetical protein SLEP1_g21565 [Rubroshorea leprosula]
MHFSKVSSSRRAYVIICASVSTKYRETTPGGWKNMRCFIA